MQAPTQAGRRSPAHSSRRPSCRRPCQQADPAGCPAAARSEGCQGQPASAKGGRGRRAQPAAELKRAAAPAAAHGPHPHRLQQCGNCSQIIHMLSTEEPEERGPHLPCPNHSTTPAAAHQTCAPAALLGGDSCQGCRHIQGPLQAVARRDAAGATRSAAFCNGSGSKGRRCKGGGQASAWRAGQQGGQCPRLGGSRRPGGQRARPLLAFKAGCQQGVYARLLPLHWLHWLHGRVLVLLCMLVQLLVQLLPVQGGGSDDSAGWGCRRCRREVLHRQQQGTCWYSGLAPEAVSRLGRLIGRLCRCSAQRGSGPALLCSSVCIAVQAAYVGLKKHLQPSHGDPMQQRKRVERGRQGSNLGRAGQKRCGGWRAAARKGVPPPLIGRGLLLPFRLHSPPGRLRCCSFRKAARPAAWSPKSCLLQFELGRPAGRPLLLQLLLRAGGCPRSFSGVCAEGLGCQQLHGRPWQAGLSSRSRRG